MLQAIHDNLKGVFAMIILGVLAVVFIFWGVEFVSVGGLTTTKGIEVNGQDVNVSDVQRAYQEQVTQYQVATGGMDMPEEVREQIKQGVVEGAVTNELIRQRTEEQRFRATDRDVLEQLQQVPAFQVDGKFSKDAYYAALRAANIEPAWFEAQQKRVVAARLLDRGIFASAFVLPKEFEQREALLNEAREMAWVVLPVDRFLADVRPDEAALAAWYEEHKADYRTAEQANLQYVEISLDDLAQSVQVTDDALHSFHEGNLDRYRVPERRRVRHILVASSGDDGAAEAAAKAAYERAVAGEDFAALAAELSQDPGSAAQGGDLGWADRETFVGPFGDAAWSMQEGEIKGPVKTQFGWHVLKLEAIDATANPSFEELRPQLEAEYRRAESESLFGDLQEQLDTEAFEAGGDLKRVADSLALEIRSVEGLTRQGGALGNSPDLIAAVFDPEVLNGSQLRTVEVAPGQVVALKVVAHQPPRDRPLEEVRDQVSAAYAVEQARKLAGERAEALVGELRGGADWDAVAAQWIPKDVTDPSSARLRFIGRGEPAVPPAVSTAAFRAARPDGTPVYGAATLGSGDAAIWTVTYVRPGSPATLAPAQRAAAMREARDQSSLRDASVYVAQLRSEAEVEVNPQLFQ